MWSKHANWSDCIWGMLSDCAEWISIFQLKITMHAIDSTLGAHLLRNYMMGLKLVRTLLNYRLLGTSTAATFRSNGHSLYAPINLGCRSCLIAFVWDKSTCQESVESDKIHNEKILPIVGFVPTALRFEVWCFSDWASQACWKLSV